MSSLRWFAGAIVPIGFSLGCVVGDGALNGDEPFWDVTIEPLEGDCPVPPNFGNRWWAEFPEDEGVVDPSDGYVHGTKLRFTPNIGSTPDENSFIDCPLSGRDFTCDPTGENTVDGRLHMQLSGTRNGEERLTAEVAVVGTIGDTIMPSPTSEAVWCSGRWSFTATRVIDATVKTSTVNHRACDLEGTVASAVSDTPATLWVANNSSTRAEVDWLDPTGARVHIATVDPRSAVPVDTALGAWFQVYGGYEMRCIDLAEVTEDGALIVVHGMQD